MKFFRKKHIRKLMAVFTGIVFLNLSFFLAEVSALKIGKENQQLIENLVRIFSTVSEEEKDINTGESADPASSIVKEVDLHLAEHVRHFNTEFIIILKAYADLHCQLSKSRFAETPSQPPEA
jgi:hypothetical protein